MRPLCRVLSIVVGALGLLSTAGYGQFMDFSYVENSHIRACGARPRTDNIPRDGTPARTQWIQSTVRWVQCTQNFYQNMDRGLSSFTRECGQGARADATCYQNAFAQAFRQRVWNQYDEALRRIPLNQFTDLKSRCSFTYGQGIQWNQFTDVAQCLSQNAPEAFDQARRNYVQNGTFLGALEQMCITGRGVLHGALPDVSRALDLPTAENLRGWLEDFNQNAARFHGQEAGEAPQRYQTQCRAVQVGAIPGQNHTLPQASGRPQTHQPRTQTALQQQSSQTPQSAAQTVVAHPQGISRTASGPGRGSSTSGGGRRVGDGHRATLRAVDPNTYNCLDWAQPTEQQCNDESSTASALDSAGVGRGLNLVLPTARDAVNQTLSREDLEREAAQFVLRQELDHLFDQRARSFIGPLVYNDELFRSLRMACEGTPAADFVNSYIAQRLRQSPATAQPALPERIEANAMPPQLQQYLSGIRSAARALQELDAQDQILRSDFENQGEGYFQSLEQNWPGYMPCRSIVELFNAATTPRNTNRNAQCGYVQGRIAISPYASRVNNTEQVVCSRLGALRAECMASCSGGTEADRFLRCMGTFEAGQQPGNAPRVALESVPLVGERSSVWDRCVLKDAILSDNARRRLEILHDFSELAERTEQGQLVYRRIGATGDSDQQALAVVMNHSQFLRSALPSLSQERLLSFALGTEGSGLRLDRNPNRPVINEHAREIRDSLGRACANRRATANRVFADDSRLREFLHCDRHIGGRVSDVWGRQLEVSCQTIRHNAPLVCQIRGERQLQEFWNNIAREQTERASTAFMTAMDFAGCAPAFRAFAAVPTGIVRSALQAARVGRPVVSTLATAAIREGQNLVRSALSGARHSLTTVSGGTMVAGFSALGIHSANSALQEAERNLQRVSDDCVLGRGSCGAVADARSAYREALSQGLGTMVHDTLLGLLVPNAPGGARSAAPRGRFIAGSLETSYANFLRAEREFNAAMATHGGSSGSGVFREAGAPSPEVTQTARRLAEAQDQLARDFQRRWRQVVPEGQTIEVPGGQRITRDNVRQLSPNDVTAIMNTVQTEEFGRGVLQREGLGSRNLNDRERAGMRRLLRLAEERGVPRARLQQMIHEQMCRAGCPCRAI